MTATAHTRRTAPVRVSLPHAIKDTAVITRRNLLRNIRLPQLLVFATIQPVMFLLLFNYVFGGSIGLALPPAAKGEYINWLLPGLLMQVAVFGSSQTAIGLTTDLQAGVIDRFRSLPMARSAVLAGRTFADLIRNAFVIGLMMTVGFLIGFRYQNGLVNFLAAMLLAGGFAYAFSWVMASIGLAVKDPETAQTAGFVPLFPLVFASSIFVPTQTLPDWLRVFADNQPISVVANALRGLILGEGALFGEHTTGGLVTASIVWIAALIAVFAPLSVRLYRRAVG